MIFVDFETLLLTLINPIPITSPLLTGCTHSECLIKEILYIADIINYNEVIMHIPR